MLISILTEHLCKFIQNNNLPVEMFDKVLNNSYYNQPYFDSKDATIISFNYYVYRPKGYEDSEGFKFELSDPDLLNKLEQCLLSYK